MRLDVTQYSADIRMLYESCEGNNNDDIQLMLAVACKGIMSTVCCTMPWSFYPSVINASMEA